MILDLFFDLQWLQEKQKTHTVEQTEKVVPFITGETAFHQNVGELVSLVSTYLIWICGSKFILSNDKTSASLWFQDTCLISQTSAFE